MSLGLTSNSHDCLSCPTLILVIICFNRVHAHVLNVSKYECNLTKHPTYDSILQKSSIWQSNSTIEQVDKHNNPTRSSLGTKNMLTSTNWQSKFYYTKSEQEHDLTRRKGGATSIRAFEWHGKVKLYYWLHGKQAHHHNKSWGTGKLMRRICKVMSFSVKRRGSYWVRI